MRFGGFFLPKGRLTGAEGLHIHHAHHPFGWPCLRDGSQGFDGDFCRRSPVEGGFWAWLCKRTLRTRTSAGTAGSRVGRARMPVGRRGRTGAAGTGRDGPDLGVGSAAGGVEDQIFEENTHRRARKDGGEPRGLTVLCGRVGSSALKSVRKGLQRQIFRKRRGSGRSETGCQTRA